MSFEEELVEVVNVLPLSFTRRGVLRLDIIRLKDKHCVDRALLLRKLEELENLYSEECEIPTNGNDPSSNKDFICFQWDKYKEFKEFLDGEKK